LIYDLKEDRRRPVDNANLKYDIENDTYERIPSPTVFRLTSGAVYVEPEDSVYVMVDNY
jgi:hypothetical protein